MEKLGTIDYLLNQCMAFAIFGRGASDPIPSLYELSKQIGVPLAILICLVELEGHEESN